MHFVLGAPGSGKSAVTAPLRSLLPEWTIIDWDALITSAGHLAGCSIRTNETTWQPYRDLMREVAALSPPKRTLLLGVSTPAELTGWPDGKWLLLDCDDTERVRRLRLRGEMDEVIRSAVMDAIEYRSLALPTLDTTKLDPREVAAKIAERVAAEV
jgi:hypothetical protein